MDVLIPQELIKRIKKLREKPEEFVKKAVEEKLAKNMQ